MKMSPLSAALLALTLVVTASVSACGRNGPPVLPKEVRKDSYPDQYPQTPKAQTGIFSN